MLVDPCKLHIMLSVISTPCFEFWYHFLVVSCMIIFQGFGHYPIVFFVIVILCTTFNFQGS